MRYIAAYLLLQIGGTVSPSAEDIQRVLSSVGIETDKHRLDTLLAELEGKDIDELIRAGSSRLVSHVSVTPSTEADSVARGAPASERPDDEGGHGTNATDVSDADSDPGFDLNLFGD